MPSLPTNRDINAALLLAPAVHPTGPNGNYSIAGSMSFENLFMVNGVTVNENLRGQANDLVHRGRDPGNDGRDRRHLGRVRPFRRRRRQRGDQVGRQPVQRIVPRHRCNDDDWRDAVVVRTDAKATIRSHNDHANASPTSVRTVPTLRVHVRRADHAGTTCGSSRPGAFRSRRRPPARRHEHPVQLHERARSATSSRARTRRPRTTGSRARTPRSSTSS